VFETIWARSFRLRFGGRGRFLFNWLAVVRVGVVVAVAIIERDDVLIAGLAMPQIQEAVCRIVTVWLVVAAASEPPWRAI
jgi:hypothetical protein